MKITVIGSGYVGLVSGICFAKIGHEVVCVDKNSAKIAQLNSGEIPIYEPNLKELLAEAKEANKISFTTDFTSALKDAKAVFIAVGTPQGEDGSADLSYVLAAAQEIAEIADSPKLIITKSTVPAATGAKIQKLIAELNKQDLLFVASNPEFLREGSAIEDFMNPDRIVIGADNPKSFSILEEIYAYFPKEKLVKTDIVTAELIKYAANSFLAAKISFINEMADLCEKTGGNIRQLSRAIGLDSRIGDKFLKPGPGFGGSCFPKDILAILNIAKEYEVELSLIDSVVKSNKKRQMNMVKKISALLGNNLSGKKIGLLGLAFKGNTDDIRYSPAIFIAKELANNGADIFAHDFEAIKNARSELADFKNIHFISNLYEAADNRDILIIATEWPQYGEIDPSKISTKKIIDLRNILDGEKFRALGFEYFSIGEK